MVRRGPGASCGIGAWGVGSVGKAVAAEGVGSINALLGLKLNGEILAIKWLFISTNYEITTFLKRYQE